MSNTLASYEARIALRSQTEERSTMSFTRDQVGPVIAYIMQAMLTNAEELCDGCCCNALIAVDPALLTPATATIEEIEKQRSGMCIVRATAAIDYQKFEMLLSCSQAPFYYELTLGATFHRMHITDICEQSTSEFQSSEFMPYEHSPGVSRSIPRSEPMDCTSDEPMDCKVDSTCPASRLIDAVRIWLTTWATETGQTDKYMQLDNQPHLRTAHAFFAAHATKEKFNMIYGTE